MDNAYVSQKLINIIALLYNIDKEDCYCEVNNKLGEIIIYEFGSKKYGIKNKVTQSVALLVLGQYQQTQNEVTKTNKKKIPKSGSKKSKD